MMNAKRVFAGLAAGAATLCVAAPPDACTVLMMEDVNSIAEGAATRISPRKSGNPSECAFEDARRGAVLVVGIREVQYAAENELQHERGNLEKIYRGKVKWIEGVGNSAFWFERNQTAMFRKGKLLVTLKFSRDKNANEVDTMQMARILESRLK